MGFTKIRLGLEDIYELIIKDQEGRKIEEWKCLKRDFPEVMRIIVKKHGLEVKIIQKKVRGDRDLDWAK